MRDRTVDFAPGYVHIFSFYFSSRLPSFFFCVYAVCPSSCPYWPLPTLPRPPAPSGCPCSRPPEHSRCGVVSGTWSQSSFSARRPCVGPGVWRPWGAARLGGRAIVPALALARCACSHRRPRSVAPSWRLRYSAVWARCPPWPACAVEFPPGLRGVRLARAPCALFLVSPRPVRGGITCPHLAPDEAVGTPFGCWL